MNREEMIRFMNDNLSCHLATTEGNQPHVRGMQAYRADEKGVVFHTGNAKELSEQIRNNPLVEMCFFNPESNTQLRVRGETVMLDDIELKKEIVGSRPFLQPWVEEHGYDLLAVFRVVKCVGHTWTMESNFLPKEYVALTD